MNRERLYRLLEEKNILTREESTFLRIIHSRVYFHVNGKKYYFRNGVHQGSPISPALFNIYIEDAMQRVKEWGCSDKQLWYKLYADDLVLITDHRHIQELIDVLFSVSEDYNLKVNEKKSAILCVQGHSKVAEASIRGIPVKEDYTYLGVQIDKFGSISSHLDRIIQRSNYLRAKMKYFVRDLSFQN